MIRRDMPEVVAIEQEAFEFPWSEEDFTHCLRQRNCIGMVAEMADSVVAFMIYELHRTKLHMLNFAVRRSHRRLGIGTRMMDKLVAKLTPDRRGRIVLEVRETNLPAQLFFRSLGFRATTVMKDFYQDSTEDAYMMQYAPGSHRQKITSSIVATRDRRRLIAARGVGPCAKIVHTGEPDGMGLGGSGISATAGQPSSLVHEAVVADNASRIADTNATSRRAKSTAFAHVPVRMWLAGVIGASIANAAMCCPAREQPVARSASSIDAVGRGLISMTHTRCLASTTRSAPTRPARPKSPARSSPRRFTWDATVASSMVGSRSIDPQYANAFARHQRQPTSWREAVLTWLCPSLRT
jgi:[ribosomal protein S18]-alanine N-acetyltransferase